MQSQQRNFLPQFKYLPIPWTAEEGLFLYAFAAGPEEVTWSESSSKC